jgi:hypothetical protein
LSILRGTGHDSDKQESYSENVQQIEVDLLFSLKENGFCSLGSGRAGKPPLQPEVLSSTNSSP